MIKQRRWLVIAILLAGLIGSGVALWISSAQTMARLRVQIFTALRFSPDDRWLAVEMPDGLALIDWRDDAIDQIIAGADGYGGIAWSPDGGVLAATASDGDGQALVLHAGPTWEPGLTITSSSESLDSINELAWSHDGSFIVSGHHDGALRRWRATDGAHLGTIAPPPHDPRDWYPSVSSLAVSPDDRIVASGDLNGGVRVWEVETGALLWTHAFSGTLVRSVSINADGRLLAAAIDQTIQIWDLASGTLLTTITREEPVTSVAFHPTTDWLASTEGMFVPSGPERYEAKVVVWDARAGTLLRLRETRHLQVMGAVWTHDGRTLAYADRDAGIQLWPMGE